MTTALTVDEPTSITDVDFDHIEEAKAALEDVIGSGRLDFTSAIEAAKAHALISIAQSLDALAFESEADGIDLTELGVTVTPVVGSNLDYYREG